MFAAPGHARTFRELVRLSSRRLGETGLELMARPTIKEDLETLFTHTRDRDQVELVAKKLAENGGKANVTEHFGFVTHAMLIGPSDAPESTM